jgi:TolA-binding protein
LKIKLSVLILIILISAILLAEYDQKAILLKQASSLIMHRQYERANKIYEQILDENPTEYSIVDSYIMNLLRISKVKLASDKLEHFSQGMPDLIYVKLHIAIRINLGEIGKAKDETLDFLSRNSGNIYFYRNFSILFEQYRQYEIAIEILEAARKVANDENLYIRELAINYQNVKDYKKAVSEFFKLIEKQKSYVNYSLSRLKLILQEDKSIIDYIEKTASSSENPLIIEVLASCLAEVGKFEKALKNYDRIDPAKLLKFAQTMAVEGNLQISEQAYRNYISKISDPAFRANANVKLAEVLLSANRVKDSKAVLIQVYQDSEIKNSRFKYRTRANLDCRMILAQIAVIEEKPRKDVIDFLNDAKTFAFNKTDASRIEYQIIRYLMLSGDFDESSNRLAELLRTEQPGTDMFKLGYNYSYLLALMQHNPAADSLLGEIIINLPENEEANDALLLATLISSLDQEQSDEFLLAYRLKLLYKNELAIAKLQELHENTKNEEFQLLAAEWAMNSNNIELAKLLLASEFQNPVLIEYSKLKLAEITNNAEMSKDFLQTNPQSVFSPEFRKILERL